LNLFCPLNDNCRNHPEFVVNRPPHVVLADIVVLPHSSGKCYAIVNRNSQNLEKISSHLSFTSPSLPLRKKVIRELFHAATPRREVLIPIPDSALELDE